MAQRSYSRADFSPTERIILLALHRSRGSRIQKDHLWIQKTVFLFRRLIGGVSSEEGPEAAGYVAYDLGPYSEEVEGALNQLCEAGLVRVSEDKQLDISSEAAEVAEQIAKERPRGALAMDTVLELSADLTPSELVLYVYATSPEWARASKIKHVLQDRKARMSLSLKLYRGGKVSVERAAEVAGIPVSRFIESLKGIRS